MNPYRDAHRLGLGFIVLPLRDGRDSPTPLTKPAARCYTSAAANSSKKWLFARKTKDIERYVSPRFSLF